MLVSAALLSACGGRPIASDSALADRGLTCTPPRAWCGATCVDLTKDRDNCGACGTRCGNVCTDGKCGPDCLGPYNECNGSCVDLTSDPAHCGQCGTACAADKGFGCIQGKCQCAQAGKCSCPKSLANCAGTCVDLKTDPKNCGACGQVCPPGVPCQPGAC